VSSDKRVGLRPVCDPGAPARRGRHFGERSPPCTERLDVNDLESDYRLDGLTSSTAPSERLTHPPSSPPFTRARTPLRRPSRTPRPPCPHTEPAGNSYPRRRRPGRGDRLHSGGQGRPRSWPPVRRRRRSWSCWKPARTASVASGRSRSSASRLGAGIALVAARVKLGRGALGAVAFYLPVFAMLSLAIGDLRPEHPALPALRRRGAAGRARRDAHRPQPAADPRPHLRRPDRTVGFAAEWAWTHVWFPLPRHAVRWAARHSRSAGPHRVPRRG
jgi:hypothetical protein